MGPSDEQYGIKNQYAEMVCRPKHALGHIWYNNLDLSNLVGALEHFLFFHILGIIIPTD